MQKGQKPRKMERYYYHQINVRLDIEQVEKLTEYCRLQNISKSEFFRHAIDNINMAKGALRL